MKLSNSQALYPCLSALLILLCANPLLAQEPKLDEFARQSRSITTNFLASLIRTCEFEVESIGLYAAAEVCRITAPQVYYEYSIKNNIILNLVSLTPRNVVTGHADAWEQAGLLKMQNMLDNGHQPEALEIVELVKEPAETYYRYMSPMIASPFCLRCHGTKNDVDKELVNSIKFFYPKDKSFGYQLGDLMGAVSIKKEYAPGQKNK